MLMHGLMNALARKVLLNEKKTERGHGRNIMLKYCLMHGKMRGLTQQELADRIGADKGYISRIERGLTVPTVATLYKIASAMGLTIELRPI